MPYLTSVLPMCRVWSKRRWLIALFVFGVLCGLGAPGVAGAGDAEGLMLEPVPQPEPAPDFALKTPDGTEVRLQDYQGEVVVVNFWATWCPPCRAEMPSMERAWLQLREHGVRFVAINVDENAATVAKFAKRSGVTFPLLLDPDGKVSQSWPVRGLPTTFVVAPDGMLALQAEGEREWDSVPIIRQIQDLRGADPGAVPVTTQAAFGASDRSSASQSEP